MITARHHKQFKGQFVIPKASETSSNNIASAMKLHTTILRQLPGWDQCQKPGSNSDIDSKSNPDL